VPERPQVTAFCVRVQPGQRRRAVSDMFKNGSGPVWAVAWSIDGNIASGSSDRTVMIWNPATGVHLKTLEGHR
jgi:WD40 repeat protein